jgi:hypothetical protein
VPFFPQDQMFVLPQQPPRQMQPQQQRPQQARATGNQRYLPAMPEMLKPRSTPAPERPALAAQDQPKVVIRGQDAGEPKKEERLASQPAKLSIPSPEELGLLKPAPVQSAATSTMEWTTARDRLEKYGAAHYRLERVDEGWRFVCALPHPQKPSAQHQFEVRAASDQEAMAVLLQRVEDWRANPASE